MQRMKDVWKRMSDDARDYWREQLFLSHRKLSELRSEILAKFKIQFDYDARLSEFKNWIEDQDARDSHEERMQENERRLKEQHPDWTIDEIRQEVLRQSYLESLGAGNFKQGLATVAVETKAKKLVNDARRYEDAKRSDEEKALSLCLEDAKQFPEVQQMFRDAFAALKKARSKK